MSQQPTGEHHLAILQYLAKKQAPQRADLVTARELARALNVGEVHIRQALKLLRAENLVELADIGRGTPFVFITRRGRDSVEIRT